MKKMILFAVMFMATVASADAQTRVEKRAVGEGTIDYMVKELTCDNLSKIVSNLPVVLRLVEGEEGHIEVSFPMQEHRYIRFGIVDGNTFILGRDGFQKSPKKSLLSEDTPIYINISASNIAAITNTSDMVLYVERDCFADELSIGNAGYGFFVIGESITADNRISLFSNGTMTCEVESWNTDTLSLTNNGYLYVNGVTSASSVRQISTGIDRTTLQVDCEKVEVHTNGEGLITYRGWADDVAVYSNNKASVRTSELKVKP